MIMSISPITTMIVALGLLCQMAPAQAAPARCSDDSAAFERQEQGWFWYCDPEPPQPAPVPDAPAVAPVEPAASKDMQKFEAFKRRMKEAWASLMVNPTPENARTYMALQTALVRRSSEVADVGQRVVWSTPEFDFTLQRPVNGIGLAAYQADRQQRQADTLSSLASTHVLFFFARSDCPYCHAFAPVLRAFSRDSGIAVFAVSLDGGPIPAFPDARLDNGMAAKLGISMVPALFLANPSRREIQPVAYGALAQRELVDRLVAIANAGATRQVDAATPRAPLPPEALGVPAY